MPKVSPLQSNFSGGEVSPFLHGRVDSERYKSSVKTCLNFIPTVQGPMIRRPGTEWVWNTKNNGVARLQAFTFSTTQAYMLEFGNNYIRVFKDHANVTFPDKTITAATKANPCVVTAVGHGYSNGDSIIIENVVGMTQLNNREFIVANKATDTFELHDTGGSNVNSTGYDTYVSGGVAAKIFEIVSTFGVNDVFDLKFTQSADVLYIVHPSYKPKKLLRYAHTEWYLRDLDLQDGPYLTAETVTSFSPAILTPGAATGLNVVLDVKDPSIAITGAAASSTGAIRILAVAHGLDDGVKVYISSVTGTTEANGTWDISKVDADHFDLRGSTFVHAWSSGGAVFPAVFTTTDVGRAIRMKEGAHWGWATIFSYQSPIQVHIDIVETLVNGNDKEDWRLGTYSATTGYPSAVCFHEDRLFLGGPRGNPQKIDGSVSGDYENFAPTDIDTSVSPDNAVSFSFNANNVNAVKWMTSDEKGLLTGTESGEWLTRPSSQGEALSPTNINAKQSTSWGSDDLQPVQAGKATIFVQKAGRKVRELNYYYDIDGFRASDMTQLANHMSPTGVAQMTYQKEPQGIVWCVRNDGVLAGMTYDRDADALRVGWHRHIFGGYGSAAQTDAFCESAQVIVSPDTLREDLWLIVQRYVNGHVVRHIEFVTQLFDETVEQRDAFFVDAGLTYDLPKTITAITKANPAVVTANTHGFSNGDKVLITNVFGMSQVNSNTYLVANKTSNTFELTTLTGANVNSTAYSTYVTGGQVRKLVTVIEGLNHLEGQTVQILADGSVRPNQTVTAGKITLSDPAATVHIGFGYNSDGELLRVEAGAADGTALGKTRRVHRAGLLVYRSLGLKIGTAFDALDVITFRKTSDKLTRAPGLVSEILSESMEAPYDFENNFCFRQDQPLPCTILAVAQQLVEQDR